MTFVAEAAGVAALASVAAAAVADVRHFEIPDRWSVLTAALFLIFAAATLPLSQWWPHAIAGAGVFLGGALLFSKGWLGGGDVKLLAACAVWSGFEGLPALLAGTALSGGLLALAVIAARRVASPQSTYPALRHGGPIPYAVAILGGAVALATTYF